MRNSMFEGKFYPKKKDELEKEVNLFLDIKRDDEIKGAIVPHAGYYYSGKCAGKVYSKLPKIDLVIIFGTNHSGLGRGFSISTEDFQTPLGLIKNDRKTSQKLLEILGLKEEISAHEFEHSIEVQLPFLQLTQGDFKIVPIIVSLDNLDFIKDYSKKIVELVRKLDKRVFFLVSSDFSHIGPYYDYTPEKNLDKEAINAILELNSEKFKEIANQTTICGSSPILLLISVMKGFNCKKVELIEYYSSKDVEDNVNNVGYAGIVFS